MAGVNFIVKIVEGDTETEGEIDRWEGRLRWDADVAIEAGAVQWSRFAEVALAVGIIRASLFSQEYIYAHLPHLQRFLNGVFFLVVARCNIVYQNLPHSGMKRRPGRL